MRHTTLQPHTRTRPGASAPAPSRAGRGRVLPTVVRAELANEGARGRGAARGLLRLGAAAAVLATALGGHMHGGGKLSAWVSPGSGGAMGDDATQARVPLGTALH